METRSVAQLVGYLPRIPKALDSAHSIAKKKKIGLVTKTLGGSSWGIRSSKSSLATQRLQEQPGDFI